MSPSPTGCLAWAICPDRRLESGGKAVQGWPGRQVLPQRPSAGLAMEPRARYGKGQTATAEHPGWAETVAPVGGRARDLSVELSATAIHLGREPARKPNLPRAGERGPVRPQAGPRAHEEPALPGSRGPCLRLPSLVALLPRREPDPAGQPLGN